MQTSQNRAGGARTGLLVAVVVVALILTWVLWDSLSGKSDNSAEKPASSPSTTTQVSGPNQSAGVPTTQATPTGSTTEATPNPNSSLASDQRGDAATAADTFVKAWGKKYGSGDARRQGLSKSASSELANLSQYTNENNLPAVPSDVKGTLDTKYSTNQVPVVTYTLGGEKWYVLMQKDSEDWVASQIVQERDFRSLYSTITAQK